MKNILCLFCDITGTINGSKTNVSSDYQDLNRILNDIKMKEYVDYILFSLISCDSKEVVLTNLHKLKQYLNNNIFFGKQFFENGFIDSEDVVYEEMLGKPIQICRYIKELEEKYHIQKVYYVDDCEMYHELLSYYAEYEDWTEKLRSIIPLENKGLSEVNQLLALK